MALDPASFAAKAAMSRKEGQSHHSPEGEELLEKPSTKPKPEKPASAFAEAEPLVEGALALEEAPPEETAETFEDKGMEVAEDEPPQPLPTENVGQAGARMKGEFAARSIQEAHLEVAGQEEIIRDQINDLLGNILDKAPSLTPDQARPAATEYASVCFQKIIPQLIKRAEEGAIVDEAEAEAVFSARELFPALLPDVFEQHAQESGANHSRRSEKGRRSRRRKNQSWEGSVPRPIAHAREMQCLLRGGGGGAHLSGQGPKAA